MGEYIGAEWVRVDLHLHSPGINSFSLPSGVNLQSDKDKNEIIEKYISKLKEAGIKIGAITDYNGIRKEWFELIKERAKEEGIIIFPGAEVDIDLTGGKYGLHVLLIFEQNENLDGINTFFHSLDKNPQNPLVDSRSHRAVESKYELEELIGELREKFNCLVIFCHPEDDKGFFKSFSPLKCARYLKLIKPDAIEFYSDDWKNKLQSTGEISFDALNRIAIIENSDPKSLDEVGNKMRNGKIRATYLKLSDFTLSAIKLALHDPAVRVRLYEKPEMTYNRITHIKINGTKFLNNIELPLNPELNTLIGGRGVGKSAILESIRYCLNLPVYHDYEMRKNFVYEVVGSGGEIEVEIERYYGERVLRYLVKRTIGKEPEITDLTSSQKISLDINQLFEGKAPVLIGQKELYYVARDKKFQLSLIDDLIGEEVKKKQKELEEVIKKLNENGEQIIKLKEKLKKKDEYEQELKNIEDEIQIFDNLKVVDKLKRWAEVVENERRLITAEEKLKEVIKQIEDMLNDSIDKLKAQVEYLENAKFEGKEIINEARNNLSNLRDLLKEY